MMDRVEASPSTTNERLQQLLTALGQEARQPLTVITGFADLLSRETLGPLNTDQRAAIGFIRSNVHSLMRRLNRTITLITLDTGQWPRQLDEVELLGLAHSVVQQIEPTLAPGKPRPTVTVLGEPVTISSNRWLVSETLTELLDSAGRLSADIAPVVSITCRQHSNGVELAVSSNGSSAAEELGRLMTLRPTDNLDAPLSDAELGAAIVTRTVALLGGTLGYADALGGGATALVHLPRTMPE